MVPGLKGSDLRAAAPAILPSLLLCDFGHLADEIRRLEDAQVPALHLDVMDGHFVPNLTYGLTIVEAVSRLTKLPIDVHLMIANPGPFVRRYREAGADIMTIHVEAVADPRPVLAEIRRTGALASLAFNPPTPLEQVRPFLGACDMALVMSVMPGFGGQEFETVALDKLRALRSEFGDKLLLEVDGGVNEHTIRSCAKAGADMFVVGSAIFSSAEYTAQVARLARLAQDEEVGSSSRC